MSHPLRTRVLWIAAVLVAVAMVAAAWIRIPYFAVGPGPAREVMPLITFEGHPRYDSSGKLVFTTVRWFKVTPWQAVVAWLDPNWIVVPEHDLYPPGTDAGTDQRRSISDMDESKIDAITVVLGRLMDYPTDHGRGALVESTVPRCPADGALYPGDLITRIDDTPIRSQRQASRVIDAAKPGEELTFHVRAAGQAQDVTLARTRCVKGQHRPIVGVLMVEPFPIDVSIASGEVGGPSAGLMWSLGLYDLMTPGDLTQGQTVAGTGTIDTEGNVGPIGGIRDKVIGAESSGATIFLAPADNMAELDGVDTGDMRVISVATFDDALAALRQASAAG